MADVYFHYTSRIAAQMIIAAGMIRPGRDGVVYLTDEPFGSGAEAADLLGLPVAGPSVTLRDEVVILSKPVEMVCLIPASRVPGLTADMAEDAARFRDERTREVIYSGGGREFKYRGTIDVRGLAWLSLPAP